jgi:hypothetical protein
MCGAIALTAVLASAANAQDPLYRKVTILTFSGPIALPGTTLPAGTYRFQLADPEGSRRVVQVASQDGTKNYGIFLSMQNQRFEPADKPVVMFRESPAGSPAPVKVWFYPGERAGYEFVYPHDQAVKIAKASHERVLSMPESTSASTTDADRYKEMSAAKVGSVDENGVLIDESQSAPATAKSTAPAPATATTTETTSATSANTEIAQPVATGTSGQASTPAPAQPRASRRTRLPRTGSELALYGLLSGLSLVAALGVRRLRSRFAENG